MAMNMNNWFIEQQTKPKVKSWPSYTLHGLNILWLRNWQLQPYLPRYLLWGIRCHAVGFFALQWAHLSPLENHRTPKQLCGLIPTAPAHYQSSSYNYEYNDSVTRVAGRLRFLLCAQGTFCFKQGGSSWSSPLISDGLEMVRRGRLVQ
jgi:hypothetical protein